MADPLVAPRYAAIWRWHFYAGMLCIPFVIWLALTGSIYLWRPQIEGWLDRRYDHLATFQAGRCTNMKCRGRPTRRCACW